MLGVLEQVWDDVNCEPLAEKYVQCTRVRPTLSPSATLSHPHFVLKHGDCKRESTRTYLFITCARHLAMGMWAYGVMPTGKSVDGL